MSSKKSNKLFAFDENAPFNARTFPIYLGWTGIFLSLLKIILPEKKPVGKYV